MEIDGSYGCLLSTSRYIAPLSPAKKGMSTRYPECGEKCSYSAQGIFGWDAVAASSRDLQI